MQKIKNHSISQLLMQLRFAPQRQRKKQLNAAEKFLSIIQQDKEYPFEFVCFHITGYRPEHLPRQTLIKGDELIDDLRIFIARLSSQVADSAALLDQKVYTIENLAAKLGISTKTIHRWRKRGLIARKFVFEDGKKRFGFLQSTVDNFLKANPDLISKASSFGRLTKKQKQMIIKQASTLAANTNLSRYQIIDRIAGKIGKVHETIRYTILNFEKANPEKKVFRKPSGIISQADSAQIHKLYQQEIGIRELMERFNRSKSSIYRIINRHRTQLILARKNEFIDSDEFLQEDAEEKILAKPVSSLKTTFGKSAEPFELSSSSFDRYLQVLKKTPALGRDTEIELFRIYNYLKYLVGISRAGMHINNAKSSQLKKIENYLTKAETVKNLLIEANLRLAVSIARKHTNVKERLLDLVSEGNFSLMRAVEKFDYSRGFRFGTYATWAISKDFARKIPAEITRPDKAPTASLVNVHRDLRISEAADFAAIERTHKNLIQVIKLELNEREQYIIINHFGLVGSLIRKNKKTLAQIGKKLNLSKERVRQIELIALQKLRHSLSIEQFELLKE